MTWEDEVETLTKRLAATVYESEPVDTEAITQAVAAVLASLAGDLQEQHGDAEALAFTTGVYSAISEAFGQALLEAPDTDEEDDYDDEPED